MIRPIQWGKAEAKRSYWKPCIVPRRRLSGGGTPPLVRFKDTVPRYTEGYPRRTCFLNRAVTFYTLLNRKSPT